MAIASIAGLTDALDDRALFEAAVAPEEPPQEEQLGGSGGGGAEQTVQVEGAGAEPAPPEQPPAAPGEATPQEEFVPSWRLREEREAREAYAGRLAERERQLTETLDYVRRMQAASAPAAPAPDPMMDPDGFRRMQGDMFAGLRADFANQLRTIQLENNLQLTRVQTGPELFDAAYQAFVETASGDQAFARAVVGAPNPGAAMVDWYRKAVTLDQIGPDPEAWFDARRSELLQDPEFLAQAVEAARNYQPGRDNQGRFTSGGGGGGNLRGSSNVTVLPPSLMRVRGGGTAEETAARSAGDGDPLSDQSLFSFATKSK